MPASRSMPLLAWIAARPGRAFAAFLGLHAAVWTALPTLLYPNLPLDLIEALIYGREWQLGYDKLPPLPWWLVEIAYRLVGHDFAYYLLAQVAVVAALPSSVWRRGRWSARSARSWPCSLSTACTTSTTPPPSSITTSIQLPFWALAGFAFHRALRGRQTLGLAAARTGGRAVAVGEIFRRRAGDPAGAVRAHRPRRAQDAGDARTLYRGRRRADHHGAASGLAGAERFPALRLCRAPRAAVARTDRPRLAPAAIRGQPVVLPDAVAADRGCRCSIRARAPASRRSRAAPTPSTAASSTWLAFGPMATVLALSAFSGRGTVAMWGYPLWLFLGLWIVLTARRALDDMRLGRVLAHLGDRVHRLGRQPSSPITRCCRITITATARCSFPAAISAAKSRNAIAPSPENRSSM